MKTKLLLTTILSFVFYLLSSQVPQGFNYQAIARDGSGNPIANATIKVKLSILSDTSGFYASATGTYIWEEEQVNVKTNAFGLFTVVFGNPGAAKVQGTAASFSAIDWAKTPLFIGTKIANPTYKNMGSAQLWSVPYSMVTDSTKALIKGSKLSVVSSNDAATDALFEVKRQDGQTVFAVYSDGVNIYLPPITGKGSTKGGFAIGSFGETKTGLQNYFFVNSDSIRAYINPSPVGKGATKGGFAIGGFDAGKASHHDYLRVTQDSTRVYVNQTGKGSTKGGFAIGGFDAASKTAPFDFFNLTPQNYFIGQSSGQYTTGLYNSYLGFETGIHVSSGAKNVFIGYHSGMNNTDASYNVFLGNETGLVNQGNYNTFLGFQSGYSNTTGSSNCFFGQMSGNLNQDGNNNVFIGNNSGLNNLGGGGVKGSSNVFIGNESGYKNQSGSYNCFIGYQTGHENTADYNSFMGYQAGNRNTTGSYNAFLGYQAGYLNTIGNTNTFMGYMAGKSNTEGWGNVFIGDASGISNTTSCTNTFIGTESGMFNTAGSNTFIGYDAGYSNTTGNQNVFMGFSAGYTNQLGGGNTLLGNETGEDHDFSNNTFIGDYSGRQTIGNNNTFLGYGSGYHCLGSGNVLIGYHAGHYAPGDNKLFIETSTADNTGALIYGEFDNKKLRFNAFVGVNTDAGSNRFISLDDRASDDTPAILGQHNVTAFCGVGVYGLGGWIGVKGESTMAGSNVRIGVLGNASGGSTNYGVYGSASGGTAFAGYFIGNVYATGSIVQSSDRSLKRNIVPLSGSLERILNLQGVSYEWKSEEELASVIQRKGGDKKGSEPQSFNFPKGTQLGVIAQDVEKVLPELVHTDADGLKSVDYIKMIPLLIEAIKDQQKEIEDLKSQVSRLSAK